MIKNKILAALAALGLAVSVSVPVAFADVQTAVDTANDIIDTTRYYWGELTDVDAIVNYLDNISTGTVPLAMYEEYREAMAKLGSDSATMTNQALIAYANASTTGGSPSATIKDSYSIVCKRKIVYPYDDMVETDYLYIYIDENADLYTPQQFGNFGVTANSMLLVRSTSWDGAKAYSIPLAENNIKFYPTYYNNAICFQLEGMNENTFVYDSATGTNTLGFRHYPSGMIEIKNNTVNTIQINTLTEQYQDNQIVYHYYIDDGEPLNVLECLLGTGYDYSMSQGIMTACPPWYVSCGYFNTQYDYPYVENNTYNNQTYINNPALPPVYVMPPDNPWHSGNTIDETTINDYGDYGLTINNGQFDLDIPVLAGALAGAIVPELSGLINGTFALQPDIGLSFGGGGVNINMIDLLHDLLGDIVVYPPVEITRPLVPAVTTLSPFDFNNLSIVSTSARLPSEYKTAARSVWSSGESLMAACGISLGMIFTLTLIGLFIWAIF